MDNQKRPFEPPMLQEEASLVEGTKFFTVSEGGNTGLPV